MRESDSGHRGSRGAVVGGETGPRAAGAVRRAVHSVVLPGSENGEVSETDTIATTLLDNQAADAETLRAAYTMRWTASESTIGENKTTVTRVARPRLPACALVGRLAALAAAAEIAGHRAHPRQHRSAALLTPQAEIPARVRVGRRSGP